MIEPLDRGIVSILAPLGIWILISGLDELILDLLCLFHWVCRNYLDKRKQPPVTDEALRAKPESAIAVFLPLWKEHRVVGPMVKHNIAALRYRNFHFFIAAYPNDLPTVNAVRELEKCYPNVHLALVPHNGPTSKADCLNWIYQRLQLHEEHKGTRFAVVMTHDAEDLIHPESLRWVNYYADIYDMVQVPVLPL